MLGPRHFQFIGEAHELARQGDWNRTDWPKLWLYNAHYFDDLAADRAHERNVWHRALVERWVAENPPGLGNGWEPYPTSLRVVNWVKWSLAGNELSEVAEHSLAVQLRFLRKRLEVHLLGNHLWANAKALVFAGCYFSGNEADGWRNKGLALLGRELDEQILDDGGHFERSPMYHAILLEDLLDLIQLAQVYPNCIPAETLVAWRRAAAAMAGWLKVMTHPDGDIAFFNDATLGIAPRLDALVEYSDALGVAVGSDDPSRGVMPLSDTGYVRMEAGEATVIADVGAIGPDYLPGHAHADTLSFELSLHGQRLVVNGGISTYDAGPERLRQRGTRSHSTVELDGQDSSEVWSSFRVARRAAAAVVESGQRGGCLYLEGSHDGYRRLAGKPIHRRTWQLSSAELLVSDQIDGEFKIAVARFLLHPVWRATLDGDAVSGRLDCDGTEVRFVCNGATEMAVTPGSWHPGFGISEACHVLEVHFAGGRLDTCFSWESSD